MSMKRYVKRWLKRYADFRVGATEAEKRAYRRESSVLLTFDDYGTADQIEQLLGILDAADVQVMVFVQGDWYEREPHLVERLRESGHIIGHHSYSHPNLLKLSNAEVRQELTRGVKSLWFRPPMGRYNRRIRRLANEAGMKIVYWTIDSDDWQGVPAEMIRAKVLDEVHPGAVVLFHLHADNTLAVLPRLIDDIRARGFALPALSSRTNEAQR